MPHPRSARTILTVALLCATASAAALRSVAVTLAAGLSLAVASAIALTYSLLAGFWGVVITDLVQFAMAMTGAIVLAALSWHAIGANEGLTAAVADGLIQQDALRFLPSPGEGGFWSASFWTAPVATKRQFDIGRGSPGGVDHAGDDATTAFGRSARIVQDVPRRPARNTPIGHLSCLMVGNAISVYFEISPVRFIDILELKPFSER